LSRSDRHDRVDDAIARWHAAPEGEADEPLAEYLGWTWSEYKDYVEHNLLPPERDGAV
jgi:hypothetical protein